MKYFLAFLKKELVACLRGGHLLFLAILFLALGIMNPAIAKLTPWMMELFAESLSEMGIIPGEIHVDALTSWTQFFKNIPIGLITLVLLRSGSLTGEYESGTLILLLTKGLSRRHVLFAKATVTLGLWTLGYWLCFVITHCYNTYFWDCSIAVGLLPSVLLYWLFGIWVLSLSLLFSALARQYVGVLLGTGGTVLAVYLIGLIPKASNWMPTALLQSGTILLGGVTVSDLGVALAVACLSALGAILLAMPLLDRKQF